jgi:hypothetical protein
MWEHPTYPLVIRPHNSSLCLSLPLFPGSAPCTEPGRTSGTQHRRRTTKQKASISSSLQKEYTTEGSNQPVTHQEGRNNAWQLAALPVQTGHSTAQPSMPPAAFGPQLDQPWAVSLYSSQLSSSTSHNPGTGSAGLIQHGCGTCHQPADQCQAASPYRRTYNHGILLQPLTTVQLTKTFNKYLYTVYVGTVVVTV